MRVKVRYFAAARDIASRSDESVVLREGASLADLSSEIARMHPSLRKLSRSVRFSVNLRVADEATLLKDSDEVGVLPPVAGG